MAMYSSPIRETGEFLMLPVIAAGFGPPVTLADGLSSPNGLTVDSLDDVFVAQSGGNNVIEILNSHGVYQAPVVVGSGFNHPMGVALDGSRNLFIADTGNGRDAQGAVEFNRIQFPASPVVWL